MKKSSKELMTRFKELEKELLETLKIKPVNIDEKMSKTEMKKEISQYIKKVKSAKKIFDEYEKTAEKIEKLAASESEELAKDVVDLRKIGDKLQSEIDSVSVNKKVEKRLKKSSANDEYKDELKTVDGKVVSVKTKKLTKERQKEV